MKSSAKLSPRKILVRIYTRHEGKNVVASVAVAGDPHIAQGGTLDLELFHYHLQKVLYRRKIRRFQPGRKNEVRFSLSGVPSGTCLFRGIFTDRHGCRMPAEIIQDKMPPLPWWFGSQEGISSKVPKPWTALQTKKTTGGVRAECWGRTYVWDGVSLLKQATSAGAKLLAGPVRFVGKVDGRAISWNGRLPRIIAREQGQVVMEQKAQAGSLALNTRAELDFDGMLRLDCSLATNKPVRVDNLVLEIPIPAAHAKYLYRFPGKWGSSENAHALPAAGVAMDFQPFIWLGDEERGLAWFCESDRNWFADPRQKRTEIVRRGSVVLLRLHIISQPVRLLPPDGTASEKHTGVGTETEVQTACGLQYTFGFQATPVKPVEKDAWDYRIAVLGAEQFGAKRPRPLSVRTAFLDKLVAAGVRALIVFEYWTDVEGHAQTTHARELKRIVRECHKRGLKVLLYFSFLISDRAPEWRDFGKECISLPKGGYPVYHYLPQPDQSAWRVCLQSPWQDLVVAGIARVMEEFDVDGVYLDGTEYPFACANTLHGCGVVQADGKVAQSYPLFATRSAMRRIYNAVKSRKPDGLINVHNSTCMTTPSLGWATSYWDGEQFGQLAKVADVTRLLPLDAFRTEFMGRQWGLAPEFLVYGGAFTYEQAWSFCLLHDVPVRAARLDPDLKLISRIWRVMDQFGRKEAEWLPYWRNEKWVKPSPDGVHASLYRHPRNGMLVVVANLSNKEVLAKAQLHLGRCGFAGKDARATDALTGDSLQMRGGQMELRLRPLGWKLIRVERCASAGS